MHWSVFFFTAEVVKPNGEGSGGACGTWGAAGRVRGGQSPWVDTRTPLPGCDDGHSMDGRMGMAACPVPLSPLPCWVWGWHPWLCSVMGQSRHLLGAAFAPRSVRLKLQRELNWEEKEGGAGRQLC